MTLRHFTFFFKAHGILLCFVQSEKQQEQQQESQDTRLAELELLLKALSVKTEVRETDFLYLNTLICLFNG